MNEYAECVFMLSVVMLSVIMLSVIMLSVIMLSVVAPFCWLNGLVTKSPNSYSGPSTLVVLSHRCVVLFKHLSVTEIFYDCHISATRI